VNRAASQWCRLPVPHDRNILRLGLVLGADKNTKPQHGLVRHDHMSVQGHERRISRIRNISASPPTSDMTADINLRREGPNADILTRHEMINVPGLPIVMGPRWNVCQFRRRAHCIPIFRSIFVVWGCLLISASYAQDVDGNQPARPWLRKASVDLAGKLLHWRLTFALGEPQSAPEGEASCHFLSLSSRSLPRVWCMSTDFGGKPVTKA